MYHELRPLAFRLAPEAITPGSDLSSYPFWVLGLPEDLKKPLRQAIAKASNRPENKVYLPVQSLNKAARMLIPDLLSIVRDAGKANVQPWLYGHCCDGEAGEPASPDAMKLIVRAWIRTSLPKDVSQQARNALAQEVAAEALKWRRETIDLVRWGLADNQTARPYIEKTVYNSFVLLPDVIAARLSKAEFVWGHYRLRFRRAPLSPGQSGVELISWPPLEYPEGKYVWPYSVVLTLTLQTTPFQPFPALHCEVGIRRWAGPEVYLPGGMETSVYLLDRVPWIDDGHYSRSFQVAPVTWEYVPAEERKQGEAPYRLSWDGALIQLLQDLHPKDVFPDPQRLKENPSAFLPGLEDGQSLAKPSAALVFRNGIKPAHGVGPGLMPRDRYIFAEQIAALLQPDFVFIPPFQRKVYRTSVHIPSNPFFEKEKAKTREREEEQLAGSVVDRCRAIARAAKRLTIEIWYQSEEIHQAIRRALFDITGYPLAAGNGFTWSEQDIALTVYSRPLGAWGGALSVKPGSRESLYDRLRESMNQRATAIAAELAPARELSGALVELDSEEMFDNNDPKPALRIGFGRRRYHTQFITPQPDDSHASEKEREHLQKQLAQRARSAVRDLLRQFGVIGLPPRIAIKRASKKNKVPFALPEPLHYLGYWLIKRNAKSSSTHIAQTLPVLIHMASNTTGIQVMAAGFKNWLSYSDALLALIEQQDPRVFSSNEIHQFFLETLERCLPAFGDTILFCHAQNLRGTWRWLNNERFTRALPRELAHHARLRIVRLRTGEHEIPEWYAQSEKDLYGSSQGIFTIGDSGHIFASVQEKPPSAMNLSKELSKILPRTKADKKTQTAKVYQPRPDVAAWNAGIGEMTVACADPGEAFMCAVVANELRHHFASHFGSPTILPLPLHLASLLQEYVLPLTKPTRIGGSETVEEDE